MIVKELEPIDQPDFNDVVIHFTGRHGSSRDWVSDVAPHDVDLAQWIAAFCYVVLGPWGDRSAQRRTRTGGLNHARIPGDRRLT